MPCHESSQMLRIQRVQEGTPAVFALSGRIEERHVAELQELLGTATETPGTTLDLREVRLVSREAIGFLGDCKAQGVRLDNCRSYILEWIQTRSYGKR